MSRTQYDQWAETYVYMYGTPEAGIESFKNTIGCVVASRLSKGRILDVGCGVGLSTAGLLEHGFEVVGIDISEKSLTVAERLLEPYAGRYELALGDARDLSTYAGQFDAVIAMSSLCDHILDADEQRNVVRSIAATVHPEGYVFIDSYDHENIIPASPDDEVRYATIADFPDGAGVYFERRRYYGQPKLRNYDTDYYLIDSTDSVTRLSIPGRAIFLREYVAWLREFGISGIEVLAPSETGMHKHLCIGQNVSTKATAPEVSPPEPTDERMVARIMPGDLPPNIFEEQPSTHRNLTQVTRLIRVSASFSGVSRQRW